MPLRFRHAPSATLAIWTAFLLASLAALLSRGYLDAAGDLATLEQAGRWMGGLFVGFHPMHPPDRSPLWTACVFAAMRAVRAFGVLDPSAQAFFVRLLQAFAAALVVWLVGRHALALGRPRGALLARWLTASLCFMPFLFVRQLAAVGCLPVLVAGLYGLDPDAHPQWIPGVRATRAAFLGGLFMGVAVVLRYEVALFLPGALAVMLWKRRFRALAAALAGLAVPLVAEGALGQIAWNRWFAPEEQFLTGVAAAFGNVGAGGMLQTLSRGHLSAVTLFVMPPMAVLLLYGIVRGARMAPMLAGASLTFLAGQCAMPGAHTHDLLPVLPFLFILAGLGLAHEGVGASLRGWRWVWAVGLAANLVLLPFWLSNSPHRSRIEPLRALARRLDVPRFLVLQTDTTSLEVPEFYMRPLKPYVTVSFVDDVSVVREEAPEANYALMYGMRGQVRWLQALREAGYHPSAIQFFASSPVEELLRRLCGEHAPLRVATLYRL